MQGLDGGTDYRQVSVDLLSLSIKQAHEIKHIYAMTTLEIHTANEQTLPLEHKGYRG